MFQFAIVFFSVLTLLTLAFFASVAIHATIQEDRLFSQGGLHAYDRLVSIFGVLCCFGGILASDTESVFNAASFIIILPALASALKAMRHSGGGKASLTILSQVLIEVQGKIATLTATNLDTYHTIKVPVESTEDCKIALPLKALSELAKGKGNATITVEETTGVWTRVETQGGTSRLVGSHADDFPSVPVRGNSDRDLGTIDPATFLNALKAVAVTMSSDDARPNLCGVYLKGVDNTLTMVATDGHRLNHIAVGIDLTVEGVILEARGVKALLHALDRKTPISVQMINGKGIAFTQGDQSIFVSLVEGSFPDFRQVLPKPLADDKKVHVNRKALLDAMKAVASYSNKKISNVRATIKEGSLELYATDPDKGEGLLNVPCEYNGGTVKVGFNYHYLIDALNALESDQVSWSIVDTLSPMTIEGGDNEVVCIVMPMRL